MEQNLIRRGQRVVLETVKNGQIWRHTFVIDIVLPQQLFLTPLTEGDFISLYEPEIQVRGYIPTPIRAYQFESRVIQSRRLPSPYIAIEFPERIFPIQRRHFFRVRALLSVQLLPLSNSGEPVLENPIEVNGTDINGGGVGVRLDLRKLPQGVQFQNHQRVQLTISLPAVEKTFPKGLTFEATGEIVWTRQNGRTMHLGIAFTSIDRRTQEQVISWCFAYQRRLIRLGLWSNDG